MKRNQVYILSAPIRSGKTSALKAWLKGKSTILGFISPDINDKRVFQDIETDTIYNMEDKNGDLIVGKYVFDSSAFESVAQKITIAWENETADYIVLDEVGPLEIRKSLGFHDLLLKLLEITTTRKPNLLIVVRNYCLEEFMAKYSFKNVQVLGIEGLSKIA